MADYIYTESEVRQMWKRSYGEQLGIIQAKCIEAIVRTEGNLVISFSGGKDSAVLLFLMAEMWSITYQDKVLEVMFANTTNEFACMPGYVKFYCAWIEQRFNIKIHLTGVHGDKSYFQITDEVGLPFVSKKVSRMVRDCKRILHDLGLTYEDIKDILPQHYTEQHYDEMLTSAEQLRELGVSHTVILNLTKITSDNKISQQRFLPVQYRPLIDAPFDLSEECCKFLKKDPIKYASKEIGQMLPVVGEMACDSKDRMNAYRQTGCNMFDGSRPKSKPLGAATEQTILRFIYEEKIPCSPVYGECVYDEETDTYKFTGEQRTGCKLCGFGLKFDPERYVRLQKLEPNVVTFAFTDRDRGGLGYMEVCTFLNEHCDMNIAIPEIEQGYYEKRALAYKARKEEENECEKSKVKRRRVRRPNRIYGDA